MRRSAAASPAGIVPDRRGCGWSGSRGSLSPSRPDKPASAQPANRWREPGPLPNSCPECPWQARPRQMQIGRNGCHCPASRGRIRRHRDCPAGRKMRAEQDVNRQAVPGRRPPQRAGRHFRQSCALSNDFNVGELFDDVPITRQHDPDIDPGAQRPGQGGGNGGETAHPDKVIDFRGDEQDLQEMPSASLE